MATTKKAALRARLWVEIDPDDLLDALDGCGWECWGWGWSEITGEGDGRRLYISVDDPDNDDRESGPAVIAQRVAELTPAEIVEALAGLPDEGWAHRAMRDLLDDNLDASTGDLLLQYLALGEVVYG